MIKRIGINKYVVYSRDGKKKLSKPMSHGAAMKRMAQVEHYASVNQQRDNNAGA